MEVSATITVMPSKELLATDWPKMYKIPDLIDAAFQS